MSPLLDALLLGQLLADLDERRRLDDGIAAAKCLVQKCRCSVSRRYAGFLPVFVQLRIAFSTAISGKNEL
jgi:hypothetical protein